MRIVSLLPSATEIICALGLADSLVGISHGCDYPPEIRLRPKLTASRLPPQLRSREIHEQVQECIGRRQSLYEVDAERLAALAPDLVVTQEQCSVCAVGKSDAEHALRQAGVRAKLLALASSRLWEISDDIRRIGNVVGCPSRAEFLIQQLQARLENVQSKTRECCRPRVFCLSWFNPLMAGGHWLTEMVELAGGKDCLGKRNETSTRVETEALEACAPEVVLLIPCGFEHPRTRAEWDTIRHQPVWKNLPAVRDRKVFVVDGSLFHRPGPRLVDGVELVAHLLHPEVRIAAYSNAFLQQVG